MDKSKGSWGLSMLNSTRPRSASRSTTRKAAVDTVMTSEEASWLRNGLACIQASKFSTISSVLIVSGCHEEYVSCDWICFVDKNVIISSSVERRMDDNCQVLWFIVFIFVFSMTIGIIDTEVFVIIFFFKVMCDIDVTRRCGTTVVTDGGMAMI